MLPSCGDGGGLDVTWADALGDKKHGRTPGTGQRITRRRGGHSCVATSAPTYQRLLCPGSPRFGCRTVEEHCPVCTLTDGPRWARACGDDAAVDGAARLAGNVGAGSGSVLCSWFLVLSTISPRPGSQCRHAESETLPVNDRCVSSEEALIDAGCVLPTVAQMQAHCSWSCL